MSDEQFQELLEAMPKIAEAVKALPTELQVRAFEELVQTFKGVAVAPTAPASESSPQEERSTAADADPIGDENGRSVRKAVKGAGTRPKSSRSWAPVRDINFRPDGKQSFRSLAEAKAPTTIDQKNLLAVFWLEQVYGVQGITVGHVLAAFKECGWRPPNQPDTSLQATASRFHWLNTRKMAEIATTFSGQNVVNHDMPIKKAAKK